MMLRKFIPLFLISWYHYCLAFLGALFFRFPSKKMKVIGVTGTKGKTTTCNFIAHLLNSAGFKTGMTTTVNFRIGDKEWLNKTKQTMLGRFRLQKMLADMHKQGCQYAVVETSSEGILQHRHRFVDYDIAVFTNLYPEHIERHGSFENYRAAKMKLFEKISPRGIGIYNLDDENAGFFSKFPMAKKYGYSLEGSSNENMIVVKAENCREKEDGIEFFINQSSFNPKLLGRFNMYNCLAAVCLGLSQGIEMEIIRKSLNEIKPVAGRMEQINKGQDFKIIIDYSYEPTSLENALKTVRIFNPQRIIAVFGSAGGGRDKWRRPVMGEVADKYADIVIVTTDDPYDEDPSRIVDEILPGVLKNKKRVLEENIFRIVDRREAIKKALSLAQKGDLVLLAGKAGEVWMNVAKGKKIPWNDKEVVSEILDKMA